MYFEIWQLLSVVLSVWVTFKTLHLRLLIAFGDTSGYLFCNL